MDKIDYHYIKCGNKMLNELPLEIIMMIINCMNVKDAFRLLSVNRKLWSYRTEIIYYHKLYHDQIEHLPTKTRFKGLEYNNAHTIPDQYHNQVKYLLYNSDITLETFGSLTHLDISISDCRNIIIPKSVYHLTLQGNGDIKGLIPYHITHLILGPDFDYTVKGCIPNNVIYLVFGDNFSQSISKSIPGSVIYLKFGHNFNRYVGNCIPKSVRVLKFGNKFNRSLLYSIPPGIVYLKFGVNFDQPISPYLPSTLKILKLGYNFNDIIPDLPHCKITINAKHVYKKKYCRKLMSKFSFLDKGVILLS